MRPFVEVAEEESWGAAAHSLEALVLLLEPWLRVQVSGAVEV